MSNLQAIARCLRKSTPQLLPSKTMRLVGSAPPMSKRRTLPSRSQACISRRNDPFWPLNHGMHMNPCARTISIKKRRFLPKIQVPGQNVGNIQHAKSMRRPERKSSHLDCLKIVYHLHVVDGHGRWGHAVILVVITDAAVASVQQNQTQNHT